jgi:hypothetical protein
MGAAADTVGIRIDPDVFVSYRRNDREFVERFVTAIEGHGPEVWWDADIGAGEDWRESIVEHLADSDCLVIVFSKDCNDSTQLVKELAVADHLEKIVIPVKIDDAEPTGPFLYELAWRNWIDASPDPTLKLDATAARIVECLRAAGWSAPPHRSGTGAGPLPAPPGVPEPTSPLPPPNVSSLLAPPRSAERPADPANELQRAAPARPAIGDTTVGRPQVRFRDAFPFHWADFVAPVLLFGLGLVTPAEDGEAFTVTFGDSLFLAVMLLAIIGLVAFPIRYYRRRANPHRVARNLLISNLTFALVGSIGGLFTASSLVEEGETTGSVQVELALGFLVFGLLFAVVSFAIFVALSKRRARRELHAHMQTV